MGLASGPPSTVVVVNIIVRVVIILGHGPLVQEKTERWIL